MMKSFLRKAQLVQASANATQEPNQVVGLTATASGQTTINLSWTADATPAPNGATSYVVERSVDGLGSWSTIATGITTNSYSDTSLSASQTRYYRVSAYNSFGGGLPSASANATTAIATPTAPSGLTATATSSTAISLSWTDNSSTEDGFKVERSTDNTNWTEIVGNLAANTTSYSATGLTASTLYYFRVRAYNAGGNSAYTSSASATTQSGGLSPSWTLDFSSGSFSGATLTRASTGTFVDSSGYVASASTDVARLTHNSSGSRLGLLVEGQRTNLFQRSAEFDNAFWTKTEAAVTANSVTSPENTTTADTLADNSNNGRHIIYESRSGDLATRRTFSVFAKKNSLQYVQLCVTNAADSHAFAAIFNLDNGTVSDTKTVGSGTITATIEDYGNGWYRCVISGTQTTGTANYYPIICTSDRAGFTGTLAGGLFPAYSGSGQSLYIWGAQLEEAANASAYIPTTTASVTRSADLVHVLDSSITNWGDPGALVVHFYPPGQAGTLISTDDAATAQVGIEASTTTAARAFWSSGSTATGTIGSGVQKAVHYWTGSTSKFCINGGTVQSGTNNFTIANADFVTLGAEATDSAGVPGTFSQYANCVIRKVEFYSGTLTDANLQTITT